jgi:membrane protein
MTSSGPNAPQGQKISTPFQKAYQFLISDIWRVQADQLPPVKAFTFRLLRSIAITFRGFRINNGMLRASALTFYSVLSIVPVLAMALGIAKGFGFETHLEKELLERFSAQQEVIFQVIDFAKALLEETRGGLIAGVSIGFLIWSIIKVLSNIEHAFNQIWRMQKHRSWSRKFTDYLAFMLICPVLILIHGSLTVYIGVQVRALTQNVPVLDYISPVIFIFLKLLPYGLIWTLFSFLYIMMPNTRVHPITGIFSGVIAGTIYQFTQWAYITFQIGVASYNAIYGSFAAIPLFLIWLQVSWLIVLFGAELSHALQHSDHYEFEPDIRGMSYHHKKIFYLAVARLLARRFAEGKPAMKAEAISRSLKLPILLVRNILDDLQLAGITSIVKGDPDTEASYQPARDISGCTVGSVLDAIERIGNTGFPVPESPEAQKLFDKIGELREATARSSAFHQKIEEI